MNEEKKEKLIEDHPKGDQPPEVLLRWIADDMRIIRRLLVKVTYYIAEAESEIPEKIRRFMNYAHDVHDVKYMHEELGHPAPEHIMHEIRRLDDRYRQILKELHSDTGAFEKVRQEMASDPDNRYDHSRQLEFKSRSKG